jgi:hypothetical protein
MANTNMPHVQDAGQRAKSLTQAKNTIFVSRRPNRVHMIWLRRLCLTKRTLEGYAQYFGNTGFFRGNSDSLLADSIEIMCLHRTAGHLIISVPGNVHSIALGYNVSGLVELNLRRENISRTQGF